MVHYACIKSALTFIQPDATYFYYEYEPHGVWWELTKGLVTTIQIKSPKSIFGKRLKHAMHRADVIRLEKLLEHGGIYLDVDVLVVRDFSSLLNNRCVLGQEGVNGMNGLCNAVIVAERNASFIQRWYDSYTTFRGEEGYWNEHSVQIPQKLAIKHPAEVTVLDHKAFFWPLWNDAALSLLFRSNADINAPDAYAHHLWESKSWRFLEGLTIDDVRERDTNFNRLVRPFVADLPSGFGAPSFKQLLTSKAKRTVHKIRSGIQYRY